MQKDKSVSRSYRSRYIWYMRVSNLFVIWGWPTILDAPRKSPSNQPANHPSIGWHAWCQGLTRQRHNSQATWKFFAWAWMERWLVVMSTRNCWKVWVNFIASWRSHVWFKSSLRGSVDCSAILVVRSWRIHTWNQSWKRKHSSFPMFPAMSLEIQCVFVSLRNLYTDAVETALCTHGD